MGSGDYTVEFWAMINDDGDDFCGFIHQGDDNTGGYGWAIAHDERKLHIEATKSSTGTSHWYKSTTSNVLTEGTWYHIAFVRDGSTVRIYRNGSQVASDTIDGTIVDYDEPLEIGSWSFANEMGTDKWLNGYMDDIRITKGVCRYPSGTTFDVPTGAFPTHGVVTYNKNDVAFHNGVSYISLIDNNTDTPPSANWELMSSSGTAGTSGTSGSDGAAGEAGGSATSGTSG